MKKLLAGMLVLVMALQLCACNKQEGAKSDVPTLLWYVNGESQPDVSSVMAEANKILEPKIGAKLDLQFIADGAFSEKMQLAMAAGEKFDLCFTGYVNNFQTAVQRGGFASLNDYLEKSPALKEALPQFAWDCVTIDGNIYAVPNTQFWGYGIHAYTFKDLADKYGLVPENVKSYKDLESYLKKIKENEPDYYPARGNLILDVFFADTDRENLTSGVTAIYDEDGNVVDIKASHEWDYYKKGYEEAHRWYKEGFLRPDIASVSDDNQDYKMGKYAMWFHSYTPGQLTQLKDLFGKEVIKIQLDEFLIEATYPQATMIAVNKKSENPEKAVKLIELLNTDKEFYNLISFGVAGKHYDKLEGDYIKLKEDSTYKPNAAWKFGNNFNAYLLEGMDADTYEVSKELNETSRISPIVGFKFDNTNVTSEISQITSVTGEYKAMMSGSVDPSEYWDEYVQRLEEAGIMTVKEEAIKQFEEWKAGK